MGRLVCETYAIIVGGIIVCMVVSHVTVHTAKCAHALEH